MIIAQTKQICCAAARPRCSPLHCARGCCRARRGPAGRGASAVAQLRQRSRAAAVALAVAGQARRELEGQSSCINNTNILNFKLQKLIF